MIHDEVIPSSINRSINRTFKYIWDKSWLGCTSPFYLTHGEVIPSFIARFINKTFKFLSIWYFHGSLKTFPSLIICSTTRCPTFQNFVFYLFVIVQKLEEVFLCWLCESSLPCDPFILECISFFTHIPNQIFLVYPLNRKDFIWHVQ